MKSPPEYHGEGTVDADGGDEKVVQHEAMDRGTHPPELKLKTDESTTVLPQQPLCIPDRSLGYYPMKNLKHGVALIINNQHFTDPKSPYFPKPDPNKERVGTARDEYNLKETFLFLGYRPLIYRDLTEEEILYIFSNFESVLEQSDSKACQKVAHDSFVCCILSHGYNGGIYSSDMKQIPMNLIEKKTGGYKKLQPKPKIFFIQACQGVGYGTEPVDAIQEDSITTSQRAHFHKFYSTVQGDKSYRRTITGSWFIKEVCKLLCEFGKNIDLQEFELRLNRAVANNDSYRIKMGKDQKEYTQPPGGLTQLQKYVHFFLE